MRPRVLTEVSLRARMDESRTFFSTLPDDVVHRIISNRRMGRYVMDPLFDSSSPFAPFLRDVFAKVAIDHVFSHSLEDGILNIHQTLDENPGFVLDECLGAVRALDVSNVACDSSGAAINLMYYMLARLGPQLTELNFRVCRCSWGAETMIRWLTSCPMLESFEYKGDHDMNELLPLWSKIGSRLKKLRLEFVDMGDDWARTLDAIKQHCVRLSDIHLNDPVESGSVSFPVYAAFLVSFGLQLKRVALKNYNPTACQWIVASCPNALVSYAVSDGFEVFVNALGAFGPQLDSLTLRGLEDPISSENLKLPSQSLAKLEVDQESTVSMSTWERFFESSLFALKELRIDAVLPTEILEAIGKATNCLTTLRLAVKSIEKAEIFGGIVRSNPSLADVTLSEKESHPTRATKEDVLELIEDLMGLFKMTQFVQVTIYAEDNPGPSAVADIMVPYRNRGSEFRVLFRSSSSLESASISDSEMDTEDYSGFGSDDSDLFDTSDSEQG